MSCAVAPPTDLAGLLGRALVGEPQAVRALIAAFTPVIQARAARALVRRSGSRSRDPRQELADLTQDVLLLLFREDGRILRAWSAERGLSLLNYVGLVAEREVAQIAGSGRRSPWSLNPAEVSEMERAAPPVESAESSVGSRDLLDRLYTRLEGELHPSALELFRLLVVEELPTADVCAMTGLSTDAVYTWRSRLLRRARILLDELSTTPSPGPALAQPTPERSDRS
jgi:DNA-directed RNA polymerase specialized sigma24 family protein